MKNLLTLLAGLMLVAASTYDEALSQRAVLYSAAAFCEKQDLDHWKCGKVCNTITGVTHLTRISNPAAGTFGYVAYNEQTNMIVVAFRGSNNVANWISNIDFFMQSYPTVSGAKVHTGFYTAYKNVSPQVIPAVRALLGQYPSASILITGHSLGAALSTFAAVDIKEQINPKNIIHFYNFGSPRTGNRVFSDYIMTLYPSGSFHRVVHYTDIVPHLPMTQFGFNHAGDEVWYTQAELGMEYKICKNTIGQNENPGCADTVPSYENHAHMQYVGIDMAGGWCGGTALFLE